MIYIIGIESSCDETAVAIVNHKKEICGHVIRSQIEMHKDFGGVVPEVAARQHIECIEDLVKECLKQANIKINDITAIAATNGPGLMGGLLIGTSLAKAMAFALQKPYIAINHLEGHALVARLKNNIPFPYLTFLASGGHCQILLARNIGDYKKLGDTLDDAIGETFDKVAKMLNLPYPGGPSVEKMALQGDPQAYSFPRPLKGRKNCDFSFSGLKTAVLYEVKKIDRLTQTHKQNICASFQKSVADVIVDRLKNSFERLLSERKSPPINGLIVAGGVAANMYLRKHIENISSHYNCPFIAPEQNLCTDNGVMIAWAGLENYTNGYTHKLNTKPYPKWPLEILNEHHKK